MNNDEDVPADFPRPCSGAVPGAALKFLAEKHDGRYVVGVTEEELRQRYSGCLELLSDLLAYCARKRNEQPDLSNPDLYARVERGLMASTELGTTPAENRWVLRQLCLKLGWNVEATR